MSWGRCGYQFALRLAVIWFSTLCGVAIGGEHRICNEGERDLLYAVVREWEDGLSLRCELQRVNCHLEIQDWFTLKPDQCNDVMVGVSWTTYLSIYEQGKDGKTKPVTYPKSDNEDSSGVLTGAYLCLPNAKFHVRLEGNLKQGLAATKSCASSASLSPINLWMRSEPDQNFVLRLR